jgi:hypothetical protein
MMQEYFNVKMMITQQMDEQLGEKSGPTLAGVSRYNRNLILDDSQHLITCDIGGTLGIDKEKTGVRNPSITAMNYMKYDFATLNHRDLSNISKLRRALGYSIAPFISCNLVHPTTKEPFFGEPYLILKINGMRLAIVSAYAGADEVDGESNDQEPIIHVSRTAPAIRRTLSYIYDNEEPDYVIAVLSNYDDSVREILDDLEGVGIVVTGGEPDPEVVNNDTTETFSAEDISDDEEVPLYHHHHNGYVMSIDIEFKRRMTSIEYIGHTVKQINQDISQQSDDLNLVDQIFYHL